MSAPERVWASSAPRRPPAGARLSGPHRRPAELTGHGADQYDRRFRHDCRSSFRIGSRGPQSAADGGESISMSIQVERAHGLEALGILRSGRVHWNLSPAALYEEALRRGEGILAAEGPLVCRTGQHTGRSPNDKFGVREPSSERHVHWGNVNRPVDEAHFDALQRDVTAYLQDTELYVLDAWAGADPAYRLPIRIVNEFAWHHLFARNMFLPETNPAQLAQHRPEFTVIDAPNFRADPARHGTRSDVFIFVHFGRKLVLIGGTSY